LENVGWIEEMNIVGTCRNCGAEVNLLQDETDEGIYVCTKCDSTHGLNDFAVLKDEKTDEEGLLELQEILEVSTELYGDTLNEDGLKRMSVMIMKMNNLENQVYTYSGMITMMVEDPKVMDNMMKRYRKKFAKT
jgi:hypothetical protein